MGKQGEVGVGVHRRRVSVERVTLVLTVSVVEQDRWEILSLLPTAHVAMSDSG
jgi:hypothetical protein